MVQLLGFQITRANDDKEKPAEAKQAFTVPTPDDGTTTISAGGISVNTWIWRSLPKMT